MNGRGLGILLSVVIVGGCGLTETPSGPPPTPQIVYVTPEPASQPPAAQATPVPPTSVAPVGSPVPAPSATPTPDPEALRVVAAQQYLAAATKANKAQRAVNKRFPKTFKSVKQARSYWKAQAKVDGTFLAEIKIIQVPPDTGADMRDLIRKVAAEQAIELEAAHARSWLDLSRTRAAMAKVFRRGTAAANLVRSDLGLPPVYS